jgi:hypothetical protein
LQPLLQLWYEGHGMQSLSKRTAASFSLLLPKVITSAMRRWVRTAFVVALCGCVTTHITLQPEPSPHERAVAEVPHGKTWRFAVSGDSRNCGDVVMPAIAKSALAHQVEFYWHLGDFRKMTDIDEDMRQQYRGSLPLDDYRRDAWGDFLVNQIAPFGLLPVYLGIGNHELYKNRDEGLSRAQYTAQFARWLDAPELRAQRLMDGTADEVLLSYYHWTRRGVDFIYLDNASDDGFDDAQLQWLERVLAKDKSAGDVHAVVVGMHRALPNSLGCGHSMNGDKDKPSVKGTLSGRHVYRDLLEWTGDSGNPVYVLASHSHYFMDGIFNTPYWEARGVLPGWIVGTAGARRYPLPEDLPAGIAAKTFVYGYLLGTVSPEGDIQFEFQELSESDVPAEVMDRFGRDFTSECFRENSDRGRPAPPPDSCYEK